MHGQPVNMEAGSIQERTSPWEGTVQIRIGLDTLAYMQPWGLERGSANNGFCKEWLMMTRLAGPRRISFINSKPPLGAVARQQPDLFPGWWRHGNFRAIVAVNTMLLQSSFQKCAVPVWPHDNDAYFKRLRPKALRRLQRIQKRTRRYIDVFSEKGMPLNIIDPSREAAVAGFEIRGDKRCLFSCYQRGHDYDQNDGRQKILHCATER